MALENFTTYTEVDPNSRIAVTSSRVTGTLISRDEDAYVYKDFGAAYFAGNFQIEFTYKPTQVANDGTLIFSICSLGNLVDDAQGIDTANGDLLTVVHGAGLTANPYLSITEIDGGTQYADSTSGTITMTYGTIYYLTFVRDETVGTYGTLYLYVYSNVTRTTLLDTLSIALHSSKKDFRYLYALQSWDTNSASVDGTAYTEALEIVSNTSTPTVTTQPCSAISTTTATGNGTITDLGSASVTQHGHCWVLHDGASPPTEPTTADSKTTNGAGSLGAFTSSITGLTAGLLYRIRAYATNSVGTSYGGGISVTAGLPNTQKAIRSVGVRTTQLRYVGDDGIEYYLQGTAV